MGYKPDNFPVYSVFFIGLLQDLLSGVSIGVNTIIFLLVYGIVISQNRFFWGKSFLVVWIGFGIILAGSCLLSWVLMSLLNNVFLVPTAIYLQYILTFGAYPIFAGCLLYWYKKFLKVI